MGCSCAEEDVRLHWPWRDCWLACACLRMHALRVQEVQRRAAYAADVTYVTNSELGFDYLRDNLAQVG